MSGDKALLGEMINCPDCGEAFIPQAKAPAAGEYTSWTEYLASPESKKAAPTPSTLEEVSAAIKLNAEQLAQLESRRVEAIASHAEKIHDTAEKFVLLAALMFIPAGILLLVSLTDATTENGLPVGLMIGMGGCLAASLWLYLIAQVIHIRANTEK